MFRYIKKAKEGKTEGRGVRLRGRVMGRWCVCGGGGGGD